MNTSTQTTIQQQKAAQPTHKEAEKFAKKMTRVDSDWLLDEEDERDLQEYFWRQDLSEDGHAFAEEKRQNKETREAHAHYLLGRLRKLTAQLRVLSKRTSEDATVQLEPTTAAIKTLKVILELIPIISIRRVLPSTELHPHVRIILDLIEATPEIIPALRTTARHAEASQESRLDQMKRIIKEFCAQTDSGKIKRETIRWEARAHGNFSSLKRYLNYLIDYYKRILVVRLDLHFKLDTPDIHDPIMAKKAFDRMLHNRHQKPSIFEHMVGYAWRLEHTPSRGCHFHVILIFDSQYVQQDINYGDRVGEYWRDVITDGNGTFWNCNRHAYRRYGLGIVSHRDEEKRKIFIQDVAFYLTKVGDYYSLKKPDGHAKLKCFGKGEAPKLIEHNGPGRPRTLRNKE